MTNALSYLRVSGKGQIDGDGFPRQRDAIVKYSRKNQISVLKEFRDEGVSGTKDAFEREGLTDLMLAIKSDGVRTVLVERADRLARDLMISEIILGECRKLGVKVIAVESDTDLTVEDGDPTRVLMRQMLGAISQWEKSIIVQKLRAARMRIRRTQGKCEGGKPFGLTAEESSIVQRILDLRRSKKSVRAIVEVLNQEKVPSRISQRAGQQTQWHSSSVRRIIARHSKQSKKTAARGIVSLH